MRLSGCYISLIEMLATGDRVHFEGSLSVCEWAIGLQREGELYREGGKIDAINLWRTRNFMVNIGACRLVSSDLERARTARRARLT